MLSELLCLKRKLNVMRVDEFCGLHKRSDVFGIGDILLHGFVVDSCIRELSCDLILSSCFGDYNVAVTFCCLDDILYEVCFFFVSLLLMRMVFFFFRTLLL